ncbi:spindle assembly abnormal protein 6 homolog [Toxorhynchites rutilus septentrionalis]|uniref:spindle assembly abnormal protein 6 homolog n=1 Tax=Toxorhynchites rutilus septentrionalis TaxID=329112 RepID=UPI00247B2CE4|nr:spindle assembly abnormal protein 6 homolog [Toxorhynchites rutilus septentrionalis]
MQMDTYFIDAQRRRGVKVLFPSHLLSVSQDSHGIRTQLKYNVVVEKMDLQNLIQIRLTEANDQSKMFISTIDNNSYERIRAEQSLHVTFQGFIDHLTKILECCKKEELYMSLVNDETIRLLQFYEKSSFKNLTHLFLQIQPASTETVLFHINQSLQTLHDQTAGYASQLQKCQLEINARDETIQRLQSEVRTLNSKLVEQENMIFNRNTEEINRLQQTIKHINESKELEEKRLKAIISGMQEKIDQQNKELLAGTDKIIQDSKRYEALREENHKLKTHNSYLREETDRQKAELQSCQNRDGRQENAISDLRRQIIDLQSKLKIAEKQKSELEAELEAEKNICQTKKNALQLTTDEIANANVVINNLNKEVMKLRSKVELRTEIAMRQEKVIQEKEKEYNELQGTVKQIHQEHLKNRSANDDYAQMLRKIKETSDVIEEKYRKKINDLIVKLSPAQNMETPIINTCLTNRYLRPHNRIE